MKAFEIYETEAKEKWGNTAAYQQYEEKAKFIRIKSGTPFLREWIALWSSSDCV